MRLVIKTMLGSVLLCGFAIVGYLLWQRLNAGIRTTYTSPNGRFALKVYAMPRLIASFGDSGGAPGFIRLYDQAKGELLEQQDVEMVQCVEDVTWTLTNVWVPAVIDWPLPK